MTLKTEIDLLTGSDYKYWLKVVSPSNFYKPRENINSHVSLQHNRDEYPAIHNELV